MTFLLRDLLPEATFSRLSLKKRKQNKIGRVLHEYKTGGLHSGSTVRKVRNRKQAIAIALSEASKLKSARFNKDYTYIPAEKWSQIPAGLRKKIRMTEEKGGDLQGVYQQARRYVDFTAEIAPVEKLNTTGKKTVRYNNQTYKISAPAKSDRKGKKYQVTVERSDGRNKTVAWGDSSREDYLVHKDENRRKNFLKRAGGIKKKDGSLAKNDPFSPNYFATKYSW